MAHRNFTVRKKIAASGRRNQDVEKFVCDLPLHIPPVQFATLMSLPWQGRPPWLGDGSSHDLLLVCVQSLPHTDHADHLDHPPSTTGEKNKKRKTMIEISFRSESLRRVRSTCNDSKKVSTGQNGLVTRTSPGGLVVRDYTCQFGRVYCRCCRLLKRRLFPFHIIDSYRQGLS